MPQKEPTMMDDLIARLEARIEDLELIEEEL